MTCPNCGLEMIGTPCAVCGFIRRRQRIYPLGRDRLTDSYTRREETPLSDNVRQPTMGMGQQEVQLVVGAWYIIQVRGEEPKFARLEGWNGDRPLFDVVGAPSGNVRASILGMVDDPFRVDSGDPPPH